MIPPAFDPDYGKTGFARDLFRLRWNRLGMTQAQFADRYGFSFGMMQDREQARGEPSAAFKVLIAAIDLDPALIERAAAIAAERWPNGDAAQ